MTKPLVAYWKAFTGEYLDIGQRFGVPMVATSQTWRANAERISHAPIAGLPVNRDCVRFMLDLRADYGRDAHPILIAGQSGPKGGGYGPQVSFAQPEPTPSLRTAAKSNS